LDGTVDLQPGYGNVHPPQEVSPEQTETYTLRHKVSNGDWFEEPVKVPICDVKIETFKIVPSSVRYGEPFTIIWDVRGAKGIRLTPPGSLQISTVKSLGSGGFKSQSKLTLQASKADFPSPGSYTFTLTADGPGPEQEVTVPVLIRQ
jgi:hypothetical protein